MKTRQMQNLPCNCYFPNFTPSFQPASPFEVFRTPIYIRRFTDGFYLNGIWQEGSQLSLSTILITGNVVNITLNGVALAPVTFTTNAANTMALIQAVIMAQPNIQNVDISTNLKVITIVPTVPNLASVTVFTITGGSSQPTATISNSPTIIPATASMQPTTGQEVKLVPEGRRDSETYKMFTSTQIYGVTTQNPDQITVLKAPFTGIIFEVIQIFDWQNNPNWNIVNHYSYIMMKLQPLPGEI